MFLIIIYIPYLYLYSISISIFHIYMSISICHIYIYLYIYMYIHSRSMCPSMFLIYGPYLYLHHSMYSSQLTLRKTTADLQLFYICFFNGSYLFLSFLSMFLYLYLYSISISTSCKDPIFNPHFSPPRCPNPSPPTTATKGPSPADRQVPAGHRSPRPLCQPCSSSDLQGGCKHAG